jgi:hypothetical protein
MAEGKTTTCVQIEFYDIVNWEKEQIVFRDFAPEDLSRYSDKWFKCEFDHSLLYQFMKSSQLLWVEIEPEILKANILEITGK